MTPEQFCYWLNGFGELTNERPTAEQWKAIKEHLGTVFHKVTPAAPGSIPARPPHLVPPQPLPREWDFGKAPYVPLGGLVVTC